MQKIADVEDHKVPPTIDDATVLDGIEQALTSLGYAGARP
jgi:hypothetical protein